MHSSCNHWMHELFVHQLAFEFIHCKWNSLINISLHGWNLFISTFSFKMYEFHPSFIFVPEAWIAPLSFTHNEYQNSCTTTYKVPCTIVSLMEACMITMYKNTRFFFWHFLEERFVILLWKTVVFPQKNEEISKLKEWVHCSIVKQMDSCLHMTEIEDFCGSSNKDQKRDSNELAANAIY
jgi:hypothetical protein